MTDLRPDIDVTKRAIIRLVDSLTGDPGEQSAIISAASREAVEELTRGELNG